MRTVISPLTGLSAVLISAVALPAHAQQDGGIVSYEGALGAAGSISVPTLGQWGLIAMAGILACLACYSLFRHKHNAISGVFAIIAGSLTLGAIVNDTVSAQTQTAFTVVDMVVGGEDLTGLQGQFEFANNTAAVMTFTDIDIDGEENFWYIEHANLAGSPECLEGMQLAPGESCFLTFWQYP